MYRMMRLSLKNWYLCELQDVDYRGCVGMVGPTGSGKTSLLDATQTVVGGLNHNRIQLNASSDARSDRRIIDYCLGYLTPKRDGGVPLRPACESIIVLTFAEERPDGSVHYVSVGVVMTAREGDAREVPVTRFIAPGLAVSSKDWIGIDKEGQYIKNWDEIGIEMKRKCPEMRDYHTSAERFVSDMLAEMRRDARQPDAKRFLNAFFNSLAFKPINDPTAFMRDFILERDDLNIDRVRGQVARWREFAAAARLIEEKIQSLRAIINAFNSWGRAVLDRVTQRNRMACAAVERRRLLYGAAGVALRHAIEDLAQAENACAILKRVQGEAEAELESKRQTLAEKGIEGRLAGIEQERKLLGHNVKEIEARTRELRQALRSVANLASVQDFIPGSFIPTIAAAQAALSIIDAKPGLEWLRHGVEDVTGHISKLKILADLPDRLRPQKESLSDELAGLRERWRTLEENVKRVGRGGSALSPHTQRLVELLQAEGIESTPLCDVVEVHNESWQLAAEMLLGLGREALIVDPELVQSAHEVMYRNRNSHNLHHCRLVKTTRTQMSERSVGAASIASILHSDNPHAMAYIANHLGSCRMAENEAELERANRAIMRNGKATSALDYQVYRDRDFGLILGRSARERSAAQAANELREVQDAIANKQRIVDQLQQAAQIAAGAAAYSLDLFAVGLQFEEVERQTRELESRKAAVLSEADQDLLDDIGGLRNEIKERKEEIEEQSKAVTRLAIKKGGLETSLETAKSELRKAVKQKRTAIKTYVEDEIQALAELVTLPEGGKFLGPLNPFLAERLKQRLHGKDAEAVDAYRSAEEEAEAELRVLTPEKVARAGGMARQRMSDDYCRKYGVERPHTDIVPYHFDFKWAVIQYNRLEKNELREHLENVQRAEREMTLAIKEDLLSRLTDKFGMLDDQLKALNAHLRKHRFTGQIYKFGKKADPAFDKIRRLAFAVKDNPDGAQAIIEKRSGDPLLREAMIELEAYIEASGGAGLEDYRRYYSFDLFMVPEDQADEEIETARGRMSLSARASVASGGEAQAPFYVAMAASMAMAYFPGGHPGPAPSGMGLVLFDEAFNKLDVSNTQSLIRFFDDLGLQLLVAAPEGERPTFTEVFDTIVTVSKSVATKTVYVSSEFPKERARIELAAINPNRKGVEGFRADLAAMAKTADELAAD